MHGWQANLKCTCAQPVTFMVLPGTEIHCLTWGFYFALFIATNSAKSSHVVSEVVKHVVKPLF